MDGISLRGRYRLNDGTVTAEYHEEREEKNAKAALRNRKSRLKQRAKKGAAHVDGRKTKGNSGNKHVAQTTTESVHDYLEDCDTGEAAHQEAEQDMELRANEKFLTQLLGQPHVKVHSVTKNPTYSTALTELERLSVGPLDQKSDAFLSLDTQWICDPGVHFLSDSETGEIVCAVRIEAFGDMHQQHRANVRRCLTLIMNWTNSVSQITKNKSHQVARASSTTVPDQPRHGSMYGLGYHGSMERNKRVVWYAPAENPDAFATYQELSQSELTAVGHLYRDGLATLYPGGFTALRDYAEHYDLLGFTSINPDIWDGLSFANSLIITRDDFSNFQHTDKDEIAVAYGLWWAATREESSKDFKFDDACDHDKISGGGFLIGDYGFGIDFERCRGLVEIMWRGKQDRHSTMLSQSTEGTTRFGTSVQITAFAAASMRKWREGESKRSQLVTHGDRVKKKLKTGK